MADKAVPTQEDDVTVIPNSAAIHVGKLVAERIFAVHGNPASLTASREAMAQLCALAAQTALNGVTGHWQ